MNCTCFQYSALELDRRSINKRIKATAAILKPLVLLAENPTLRLKLLRCPHCAQHWQTGWEWSLRGSEYAYHVPEIDLADWQQEPYLQPAAWMVYGAMMEPYYAKNTFEPSNKPCGVAGCPHRAIRFSGVCEPHHVEQLQQFGMLPKRPVGRLFPPYGATAPAA
ncbi:hypothetical protein MON38_06350 [Hymenobacter sp. DH14]|uniref:Uncharacterized protein n=1 Tax=Hymenobacter cyanobacteriorum TaxID=2926463 RepID=A0A9X1VEB7_9BACT|nr:hypothetical protein [Hymenobacter cyanobacteriorum]MCI1187033.1 hypothetical protein [Hymenobacter cyanobacteriorum]